MGAYSVRNVVYWYSLLPLQVLEVPIKDQIICGAQRGLGNVGCLSYQFMYFILILSFRSEKKVKKYCFQYPLQSLVIYMLWDSLKKECRYSNPRRRLKYHSFFDLTLLHKNTYDDLLKIHLLNWKIN